MSRYVICQDCGEEIEIKAGESRPMREGACPACYIEIEDVITDAEALSYFTLEE